MADARSLIFDLGAFQLKVSAPCFLSTGNAGKLREFQQLLSGSGFEVLPQSDFNVSNADETGTTIF